MKKQRSRIFVAISSFLLLTITTPLLASDGWYLLIPPRSKYNEKAKYLNRYRILDNKPLSQWHQQGAYDSAAVCEEIKSSLLALEQKVFTNTSDFYSKSATGNETPIVLEFRRDNIEHINANILAYVSSRCVRSNDPRLKH